MTKSNKNLYLKLRGNIWWYQRRIPKDLLHLYPNQKMLTQSLETSNAVEARRLRDAINANLPSPSDYAHSPDKIRYLNEVKELKAARERDWMRWDDYFDEELYKERGDIVAIEAHRTVGMNLDILDKYAPSLKSGLDRWTKFNKELISADSIKKTANAVISFLKHHKINDIPLRNITREMCTIFLRSLENTKSKGTCQAYMSRLKMVWQHSHDYGDANGENPFSNHRYLSREESNKYQMFTPSELSMVISKLSEAEPCYTLLTMLALFTGCRISELCSLTKESLYEINGITYIYIEKGKTANATRNVPITQELAQQLWSLAKNLQPTEPLLGIRSSKAASRRFSNLKSKMISDDTKCFHSLRVMFITALKRSGVSEYISAEIAGHERGTTMSYGYYAKDTDIHTLYTNTEKAVKYIRDNWL